MHLNVQDPAVASSAPDVRAALEASGLFRGLDARALNRLERFSRLERVPARATLYVQGDQGKALFVLIEGSIKLTRSLRGAREHVVRLARPGEVLGESLLFSDEVYSASAAALQSSRLLSVAVRPFVEELRRDPHLAWNVMERLGKRIKELQTQTDLLATHTAEQKVAAYLSHCYRELQANGAATPVIALACRRSELASLLALAPETLCRVITEFKRRGWIRSENGQIVVLDADALADAAPG